jgi:hypothetical protein
MTKSRFDNNSQASREGEAIDRLCKEIQKAGGTIRVGEDKRKEKAA